MKYAVVKFNGNQYRVSEGEKFTVTGFVGKKGESVEITEVLLLENEGKIILGKPMVKEAKVKTEVLEQKLGDKITIGKFKAKTGYRRKNGFRAQETELLVKEILA